MRKFAVLLLCVAVVSVLAACGNTRQENADQVVSQDSESRTQEPESMTEADVPASDEAGEAEQTGGTNMLIAYFSRAGENYNVGTIEKGNTEIIAEMIAEQTGGSLFHIETVTPYPESYMECTQVAQQEQRDNARPELTASVENMDDYEIIFLGYPYMEQGFESVLCVWCTK